MKYILSVLLTFFSVYAFGQGSPTGAKTQFKNGVALGSKDSSSFTANDSLFLTIDRNSRLMWRGNGTSATWRVVSQVGGNDFIRNQTGSNLSAQTAKFYINDTGWVNVLRTTSHVRTDSIQTGGLLRVSSGLTTPNNTGYSIRATSGVSINMVGVSSLDTGYLGSNTVSVTLRATDQIRFSNNTTGARQEMPSSKSGIVALTSDVTDSSAALRASINTKLNISDTAAMKATVTLDRVLQAGNTTGRTFTAGGATLTGALSGTSGTFDQDNFDYLIGQLNLRGSSNSDKRLSIGYNTTSNYGFIHSYQNGLFPQPLILQPDITVGNPFVGIGDTTPTRNLDVNGTFAATGVYSEVVGGTNRDVFVDNTGLLGYVSSIRASKKNILPLLRPNWLQLLNPVSFHYRLKDSTGKYTDSAYNELEYGLIAEDVEKVNPEMVFYDVDSTGKHLRGVSYSKLIIPILKEVQEQKKTITSLEARIANLEALLNVQVKKK